MQFVSKIVNYLILVASGMVAKLSPKMKWILRSCELIVHWLGKLSANPRLLHRPTVLLKYLVKYEYHVDATLTQYPLIWNSSQLPSGLVR